MTTTIVFGEASDGAISSQNNTYSTARAGSSLAVNSTGTYLTANGTNDPPVSGGTGVGQVELGGFYVLVEAFLAFDLDSASIPGGDSITDADLVLVQDSGQSTGYTINARAYDWGASLTTGDWVPGSDLSSLDLLASHAVASTSSGTRTFVSNGSELVDFTEANRAGVARMVLASSELESGSAPGSIQTRHIRFFAANASGTTNDPRLVIEHEEVPTGDALLEVKVAGNWEPLNLEVRVAGNWQPLTLERITT